MLWEILQYLKSPNKHNKTLYNEQEKAGNQLQKPKHRPYWDAKEKISFWIPGLCY